LLQPKPAPHCSFAQHCCPAPPHAAHVPFGPPVHATCGAVHVCCPQHGSPDAPHVPHAPLLHVPPMFGHALPADVHTSRTQQPPELHVFRSQQGWPGPPHCAQTSLLHALPAPHCRPGQHAWPAAPHGIEPSPRTPPSPLPLMSVVLDPPHPANHAMSATLHSQAALAHHRLPMISSSLVKQAHQSPR